MHFSLITIFPEFFYPGAEAQPADGPPDSGPLGTGLMQKAIASGLVSFSFHNPRDAASDPHRTVDDRPYGGGPGMVMLPGPLAATIESLGHAPLAQRKQTATDTPAALPAPTATNLTNIHKLAPGRLVYLSPKGRPLTQEIVADLAKEKHLTLICGRYEGIDSRIEDCYPVECFSVGDFVLNGGEAGALCLVEAVARLLPGFMGHEDSGSEESFSDGLLEYRQYTRPEMFQDMQVPDVLRSGDHGAIATHRRCEKLSETLKSRPDILAEAVLTPDDRRYLRTIYRTRPGRNLHCALVHYPVLDKAKNSVAVSLTNLDVHDIGRSSCTYGLGGFHIVTPLKDQLTLLADITRHWTSGAGGKANSDRKTAFGNTTGHESIDDAVQAIHMATGQMPFVAGTAASIPEGKKKHWPKEITFVQMRQMLSTRPVLLLFGTGHGLAPEARAKCEAFLPPLRWHSTYNHLSVRSACAIILDRILGDWF